MKTSDDGLKKLVIREGLKLQAYKDTKGIWTIGVGHTGPEVHQGLVWTRDQVMLAFQNDIKWAEDAVNDVGSPLAQHQFDALVSFVFNIGAAAFAKSTMKRMLDIGDHDGAAWQFDRWNIPKEIIGRRMSEKAQFMGQ